MKQTGLVNTYHKYGYGHQYAYMNSVDRIAEERIKITEAQYAVINDIEKNTSHKFSGHTKESAANFIQEYLPELEQVRRDEKVNMSPEDIKLFKRGVAKEDIKILRKIEEITGLDFSQYRQVRMEAYRFIEEYKGCLA